jgi:hypothetical protein
MTQTGRLAKMLDHLTAETPTYQPKKAEPAAVAEAPFLCIYVGRDALTWPNAVTTNQTVIP